MEKKKKILKFRKDFEIREKKFQFCFSEKIIIFSFFQEFKFRTNCEFQQRIEQNLKKNFIFSSNFFSIF